MDETVGNGSEMSVNFATQASRRKAYFVGGGIAALAGAVFLIRDAGFPGRNIHILERLNVVGGSLDGSGSPAEGYVTRGGRMFEEHYVCTYDLLSTIPSLTNSTKSVKEEIFEFTSQFPSYSSCRLLRDGQKVDFSDFGLSERDRLDLTSLFFHFEDSLGSQRVAEWFSPEFFRTNFWFAFCTTYAFQPWHSVAEFRRYMMRLIQLFPQFPTMGGIYSTRYNQFDSIILPLLKWLTANEVNLETDIDVTGIDFEPADSQISVRRIRCDGGRRAITVQPEDLVFITNGCMTDNSTLGSMTTAPTLNMDRAGTSWALWQDIANGRPGFGSPSAFADHIDKTKWESFTVTLHDRRFFKYVQDFTANIPGRAWVTTIVDSNWLMSFVLPHQPHSIDQPADVNVFWGYGLFPDRPGNFIEKPMAMCNGREILEELFSHLRVPEAKSIIVGSNCIPCMMPFITSQFMPRKKGDRPPVVPEGALNFAFLGQFCEIRDDIVFTVEYSVRSAQMAVYKLLDVNREVPTIYKGQYDPQVLVNALLTLLK